MQSVKSHRSRGKLFLWLVLGMLVVGCSLWIYRNVRGNHEAYNTRQMEALQSAKINDTRVKTSSSDDWPQWRGPLRNGHALEKDLDWQRLNQTSISRHVLWERPLSGGFSSIVVANGQCYTMTQDGNSEAVVCWNSETGDELWRYRYQALFHSDQGSGPRSTPCVDGNLLFTVGATGMMHCLHTQPKTSEGKVVWKRDLLSEFGGENLRWGVSFSPVVRGDLVYAIPGGANKHCVIALNKHDGSLVWHSRNDKASYSSPIIGELAGKEQLVCLTGSGLVGMNPDDGTIYWCFPWQTRFGGNVATPILVGDYIFVSTGYGKGCGVVKIEVKKNGTMQPKWAYKNNPRMENHFSTSIFHDGHIYGFNNEILTCLDVRTGKTAWRERGFGKGTLIMADGNLVILGEHGDLAIAPASPEGFQAIAQTKLLSGRCWSAPALANGRLYVRNEEKILCLDLRTSNSP